jgi:hypothetical protein
MSLVKVSGNASGTGTLTIAAPNTNSDYTLTLPTGTGTFNISGVVNEVPAGTVSAPSIYPTGDTNTGIFFPAADTIAFTEGGTEAMRIDSSGRLLVNATAAVVNAQEAIGVISLGSTGPAATFKNSAGATSAAIESWNSATSGNNLFITFSTEGTYTTRGTVSYNRGGGLVAYNTTSDYRAKTVKGNVQNALGKVALLKPCYGRMNDAEHDIDFFVAHELQEVVSSAVTGDKDAVNEDGSPNYQMVDKSALIPLLTAAIQEQQALITQLQADVAALKGASA